MSCATALAAAFGTTTEVASAGTGPAPQTDDATITLTDDGIVIAAFVAYGQNTPDAHNAHLTTGTEVFAGNTAGITSGFEAPTWAIGYDTGQTAGDYTAGVSWVLCYGSNNATAFALATVPTLATAPLQEKHASFTGATSGKVLFDDEVTEGSIVIMAVTVRAGIPYAVGSLYPPTGWTEITSGEATIDAGAHKDSVGIYMRCVAAGDGRQYGVSGSGSKRHTVTAMEWEILAAPPPPPPEPPSGGDFRVDGVKFERLLEAKIRVEDNAAGEGYFVIARGDPQATPAMLYAGALVECTFPEIDPDPIFEFFLEEGDFDVISSDEEGGEELAFSGPGSLSMLRRAIVDAVEYDPGIGSPNIQRGRWVFGESNTEGRIITKLINEAQDPARPSHPLLGMTRTFDAFQDTDNVDWDDQTLEGKWRVKIGATLYDAVMRLVNSGLLSIEMAPGLILNMWREHGVDRRSSSFADGKVRFVRGVNIADELNKQMHRRVFQTHDLVKYVDGDDEVHYIRTQKDAGDFSYDVEGYYESESSHKNTARRQAKRAMAIREEASDALMFGHVVPYPGRHGTDPDSAEASGKPDQANGVYLPGPVWTERGCYWVGDLVTVHTGTDDSDFEFNNATKRVYAITLYQDSTGYLANPIVELNAPHSHRGVGSRPSSGYAGTLSDTGSGGTSGGSGGSGTSSPPMALGGYQLLEEKGDPDGYAGLDGDGHVPADQLGDGSTGDGILVLHDDGTWGPVGSVGDPVEVVDPATGTITLDYDTARFWDLQLSGNVTIDDIDNPPASGLVGRVWIIVRGDGTHDVIAWPASFEWMDTDGTPTATPPALFTTADARNVIEAVTEDGGTTWGAALVDGSSGGGSITLEEDGVVRTATMSTLNVRHGLDADASGNVDVDESELTHNSLGGLTSGDPHTQYRLEADNHSHQSSGLQAGTLDHGAALTGLGDDDHPQYVLKTALVAIVAVFDGGGSTLTAGEKLDLSIPFACTITGWRLLGDPAGAVVIDTWKDTYGAYPPDVTDAIWGGSKPTISATNAKNEATGLSIAVSAGDTLRFKVDSVTSMSRVTLTLTATRT